MKALVVCKHSHEQNHPDIHKLIEKSCDKVAYAWKDTLTKKELEEMDLIISIGGDGTALSASHFNENKPLLAVNSSPETSIGALTTINLNQLQEKLEEIKQNKYQIELLERIEVQINNKQIEHLALNDVFIASEKAYHISKYKIIFKDREETQRSSGLIFSTGTGSTAWFHSAGGKPFSPQEKFIKMITREPYCGKSQCSTSFQNLQISENEEITIIPSVKSVLAIDSIREYLLNPDDKVTIKISKHPLKRIV